MKKNLLIENRSKKITFKNIIKVIKEQCLENFNFIYHTKSFIYRGKSFDDQFLFIQPSLFSRVSANTDNYYTLMIDNFPEWKAFPKRSKSIVGTTDKKEARAYRDIYLIIPFDKAKFGVCPERDIWFSFEKKISLYEMHDIDQINKEISYAIHKYVFKELNDEYGKMEVPTDDEKHLSFAQFISLLQQAAHTYQKNSKPESDKFIKDLLSKDPVVFLRNLFSPHDNGFELKDFQQLPFGTDQEIWTDNKCVTISSFYFTQQWQQLAADVRGYG